MSDLDSLCGSPSALQSRIPPGGDRVVGLVKEVVDAFNAVGCSQPTSVELLEYCLRLSLPTGGSFDLWYGDRVRATAFRFNKGTPEEHMQVRTALQLHMPRPCPAEEGKWSRTRERSLRTALYERRWRGLWVEHKPLRTLVAVRRNMYPRDAVEPAYSTSGEMGVLVLEHSDSAPTRVLSGHGKPGIQQRLLGSLQEFGLVPASASLPSGGGLG